MGDCRYGLGALSDLYIRRNADRSTSIATSRWIDNLESVWSRDHDSKIPGDGLNDDRVGRWGHAVSKVSR